MPRRLKPQQVREVRLRKLNVVVPVMLDRDELDFFAVVAGEIIRAPSAKQVEDAVKEKVLSAVDLTWQQIIICSVPNRGYWPNTHGGLTFEVNRHEIARNAAGKWVERRTFGGSRETDPWGHKLDPWNDVETYHGPTPGGEGVLPYSEELWQRCRDIQEAIEAARKRLLDITLSPDAASLLMRRDPARLLPAATPRALEVEPEAAMLDMAKSCRERGDHFQTCTRCPDSSCCDNTNPNAKR